MAQAVRYFEDFQTEERRAEAFSEGPFVIVNAHGWRIEVKKGDHKCPILPHTSIYELKEQMGMVGKTDNRQLAESVCDALNQKVRLGEIVETENGLWKVAGSQLVA